MRSRTTIVIIAALVLGAPGLVLRVACVGEACAEPAEAVAAEMPYCSLPGEVRAALARGFRDHRSVEIYAVAGTEAVTGGTAFGGALAPPWPSAEPLDASVPVAFAGAGVASTAEVPDGTRLDAIAPTLAEIMGLDRPHPQVRSGTALPGVASGKRPRLVLVVAVKGAGSADLEGGDALQALLAEGGGTMRGDPASLPLDPVAQLTTIGTGALPYQHGVVGALLRAGDGSLARAWGSAAPSSIVAALGDDVAEHGGGRVALVAHSHTDRGLTGGDWYPGRALHAHEVAPRAPVAAVQRVLDDGFGDGRGAPDLLGVVLAGQPSRVDARLERIVDAARTASDGSVAITVTATGPRGAPGDLGPADIAAAVDDSVGAEVVEGVSPGGLFLDQEALARHEIPEEEIVTALGSLRAPGGTPLFADVFSSIAISFARYC